MISRHLLQTVVKRVGALRNLYGSILSLMSERPGRQWTKILEMISEGSRNVLSMGKGSLCDLEEDEVGCAGQRSAQAGWEEVNRQITGCEAM